MNFKTLIAKIKNFFIREFQHVKIGNVLKAVETDYQTAMHKAEVALSIEMDRIHDAAALELTKIERTVAIAAKRAQGLAGLNVLSPDDAARAAQITPLQ